MNKFLIFIATSLLNSFIQASFFEPRAGKKLDLDVVNYLNSDDKLAKDAMGYIVNYFNGAFAARQAQALLSFAPDLVAHKTYCRSHWECQKVYYRNELESRGMVVAQGDPLCPPIYMQDKDQTCRVTINGQQDFVREVFFPRRVDIDKYVISYAITMVEEDSIAAESKPIDVHCNADDRGIKIPITLKENNRHSFARDWSCYYPNSIEEIELHEGVLGKVIFGGKQEHTLETISVRDLLAIAGKKPNENSTIFLKLVNVSFLDQTFDRFPRNVFFIRCIVSGAASKKDKPQQLSEQSWIIKKMYHYKHTLFVVFCIGSAFAWWYCSEKAVVS